MTLRGKVVAIAGAGGALGSTIARRFAAEGASLFIGDLDAGDVETLSAEIESEGGHSVACALDVTSAPAVDAFVNAAVVVAGRLDVMINNAGVLNTNGRIHNLDDAEWYRVFNVNLMGTLHGLRAACRVMRTQDSGGSIVNTASVAGITAWPYAAPYAVSKAAVIQLTKVAALEYARDRIRINCVCPGTFLSNIHRGIADNALSAIAARHPLGLGAPEDVVGAFLYLAGDESSWTTGTALICDGGYAAP